MTLVYLDLPQPEIEEEIERMRERMSRMAGQLGVLHPDVVRCSEHLDKLLLQYYAIKSLRRN